MGKYSTVAGIPTQGETFSKLIHHLREAQDQAAMLAHLHRTETGYADENLAHGWLGVEELLKRLVHQITEMAMRKRQ